VTVPRVNDKRTDPDTGERKRFSSAIVPPWCRKTPKITGVLPLLYLHGLSSGDFVPALGQFPGSPGRAVSGGDHPAHRDLEGGAARLRRAGPVRRRLRLPAGRWDPREHPAGGAQAVPAGDDRGARRWPKELVALADGYRESAESWADLLRDCSRRGMRAPVLAAGDGALGFWNGLREVFPEAREGRCWFHKTANVLAALPKPAHPAAKKALAEIWGAEDKPHALAAVKAFDAAYGAKFPTAAAKITDDAEELLAFSGYPCEHWVHLRTTNPIESPSPRSGTGPRSPGVPGRGQPGWPWLSSSSSQRKTAGAPSTHPTSSRSCAPERPSSTESSSNGPARTPTWKQLKDLHRLPGPHLARPPVRLRARQPAVTERHANVGGPWLTINLPASTRIRLP
jgi:Transposase, Mutator family